MCKLLSNFPCDLFSISQNIPRFYKQYLHTDFALDVPVYAYYEGQSINSDNGSIFQKILLESEWF